MTADSAAKIVARGWCRVRDPALAAWAAAVAPVARAAVLTGAGPWRCGGTWFVGVDALPNDAQGAVAGGPGLPWAALGAAAVLGLRPQPLHPAQLSVMRPGYPRQDQGETAAAFAFRRDRGAAHLDGLIADAAGRRRVAEPHAYILGIALNDCSPDAAPLTVWEGSAPILRAALGAALAPHPPAAQAGLDITEAYVTARRRVLAECPRRDLALRMGEAVVLDRHLLHGVSPWGAQASAPPEGRMIAYFRPLMASTAAWLAAP